MKNKEKLLRIRPFNMANFSGSFGYIPMYAMLGMIASLPATLFLWTGLALSLKKEDGKLNYQVLKRRLNWFVLPICLVVLGYGVQICVQQISFYGRSNNILFDALVILWSLAFPSFGMYCSMLFSAMLLNAKGKLSKGKWFLLTLLFAILLTAIGFFGLFFGLMPLTGLF